MIRLLKREKIPVLFVTLIAIILAGCSGRVSSTNYLREEIDYSYIQKICVLPFTNDTEDELAGERTRDVTITQILALGLFDTVDKGLVDAIMVDEDLKPGAPIDPLSIRRIGQRLQTQALILGTIDMARDNKVGSVAFPQIAVTLRLVDANSGLILWQASGNVSGESWWGRLFGITPKDHYELTVKLIRSMLQSAPAG